MVTGYQEYLRSYYAKYIGARVRYKGRIHTVVDVDYNGFLLIDIPTDYAETTAVIIADVEFMEVENE